MSQFNWLITIFLEHWALPKNRSLEVLDTFIGCACSPLGNNNLGTKCGAIGNILGEHVGNVIGNFWEHIGNWGNIIENLWEHHIF